MHRHLGKIYICLLIVFFLIGIFAPFIAPMNPLHSNIAHRLEAPKILSDKSSFLLGSDALGRDILSRVVYGTRISMFIGVISVILSGVIGMVLGILAGYFEGIVGGIIMRVIDIIYTMPFILIALLIAVVLGPSIQNVIFIIVIVFWSRFARMVRGEVLSLKQRDFVNLARICGCSSISIMIHHIVPNVLNLTMVLMSMNIGFAIMTEAILSFLGAGVPPPTPSWGNMIAEGRNYLTNAWWIVLVPSIAIFLLVGIFVMFGEWLRVKLDPTKRGL